MLHVFEKMRGFVILMLFMTACQANISNKKMIRLKRGSSTTQGKVPNGGFLEELSARNEIDCARSCTKNDGCASMYYLDDIHGCKLHDKKIDDLAVSLDNYSTAVYYEVDSDDVTTTNSPTSSIPTSTSTTTTNTPTSSITTSTSTAATNSPTSSIPTGTSMAPLLETAPCPSDDSMFRPAQTTSGTSFQFRIFTGVARTFDEAVALCQSHGAKLYKILSPEKFSFTLQLMSCPAYNTSNFWINGINTGGAMLTIDGEAVPMTSDYWAPSRPNNSPPVCLWIANIFGYFFDDHYCDETTNFQIFTICEI